MRDPIAYAIPFFFLLILAEYIYSKRKGLNIYRLNDTISNLSCGVGNRLVLIVSGSFLVFIYEWIYTRYAIMAWDPNSVLTWIVAFVLGDFVYYWWHRASHRVNFLWAIHVIHHQSEDYNLGVALRQAWLSPISYFPFFVPLAFLGLPTNPVFVGIALNLVYQFWIHTQLIDQMGAAEKILNTPSHHRVHHGINRLYLDKNYAGVFITWDKLFKTFELETEKVIYGIVTPLKSWSPLWCNIDHWYKMIGEAKTYSKFSDKIKIFFKGPEWSPGGSKLPDYGVPAQIKFEAAAARPRFLFARFVVLLIITYVFLWNSHLLTFEHKFIASAAILLFSGI